MGSGGSADASRWRDLNRAFWDERVPAHVASDFYDVAGFKAGADTLEPHEVRMAGDVAGLRVAHLQCHFGLDSLSWARRGASVVGLDFSPTAVATANGLAAELDLDGRFVCADVYDAASALGGERFDVVYTGLGALNWLPDLARWAAVVRQVASPGGRLLLSEFHPVSWMFDQEPTLAFSYFDAEPFLSDEPGSYADRAAATEHDQTVEFAHPIGEVLTVLLAEGFVLRAFEEYDHTLFPQFPWLTQGEDGRWRPDGVTALPLMYALVAEAPR